MDCVCADVVMYGPALEICEFITDRLANNMGGEIIGATQRGWNVIRIRSECLEV